MGEDFVSESGGAASQPPAFVVPARQELEWSLDIYHTLSSFTGGVARVVAVGVPHHITQRGNPRQAVLTDDASRSA